MKAIFKVVTFVSVFSLYAMEKVTQLPTAPAVPASASWTQWKLQEGQHLDLVTLHFPDEKKRAYFCQLARIKKWRNHF